MENDLQILLKEKIKNSTKGLLVFNLISCAIIPFSSIMKDQFEYSIIDTIVVIAKLIVLILGFIGLFFYAYINNLELVKNNMLQYLISAKNRLMMVRFFFLYIQIPLIPIVFIPALLMIFNYIPFFKGNIHMLLYCFQGVIFGWLAVVFMFNKKIFKSHELTLLYNEVNMKINEISNSRSK